MAEASVIAGWFASAAVSKLSDSIRSFISGRYQNATGIKRKLQSVENNLEKIKPAIEVIESIVIAEDRNVASWLNELKDVVYGAEDIIDIFNYRSRCRGVEASGNVCRSFAKKAQIGFRRAFLPRDSLHDLSNIASRLDRLCTDGRIGNYRDVAKLITSNKKDESSQRRQTSPIPTEPQVFGRKREMGRLLELVLGSSDENGSNSENFSVVSIVGLGGVGKTTLAKCLYNHEDIQKHFDPKAWVCVSNEFDMRKVMIGIFESVSRPINQDLYDRINLGTICEDLSKLLSGKRFLIVLDDVWEDMATANWEQLISVFRSGKEGSKIVVSARNKKVADIVNSRANTIDLLCLEKEEYWEFFKCCAFGNVDPKDHPKLECIGKEIADKLGGLPLAAKAVGSVLKVELEERRWSDILENKVWQKEDRILPSLRLSYNHLPAHLKQCFVYCALFPKGYMLYIDKLVHMWVAQGYVTSSSGTKTLEEEGREYFNELHSRSFFQHFSRKEFVIHDLLRDLAESIIEGEIVRVENDSSVELKNPNRIHHLFVRSTDLDMVLGQIKEPKKLCSLVYDPPPMSNISQILHSDFKKKWGLRVLILGNFYSTSHLTINNMIHLRYLEFPLGNKLPISLGRLYYLQVLVLSHGKGIYIDSEYLDDPESWVSPYPIYGSRSNLFHCFDDQTTVSKIFGKLSNLRYINTPRFLISAAPSIGKLTSLQRLTEYEVRKQEGYRICELRNLNQIRGSLRIVNLENVANKEEAKKAELLNKVHLEALSLWWNKSDNCSNDVVRVQEEVLEELQPHSHIKGIVISRYMGVKHPSWLNESCLSNIESISLLECDHLECLPPLGKFPFLKFLSLKRLMSLKEIGLEGHGNGDKVFPALAYLSLNHIEEIRVWSSFKEDAMPLLSKLEITGCFKLEALPPLGGLQRLETLCLGFLDSVEKIGTEFYGRGSQVFPKLKNFTLSFSNNLKEWLVPNDGRSLMPRLTYLHISYCSNLKVIPPLGELPCLAFLHLEGLFSLEKIGVEIHGRRSIAFPALESLELSHMTGLTEWSAFGEKGCVLIPHLRHLEITDCPKLKWPKPYPSSPYPSSPEELEFDVDDGQMFHELFPIGSLNYHNTMFPSIEGKL